MKKSGLVDSPFFAPHPEHAAQSSVPVSPADHIRTLYQPSHQVLSEVRPLPEQANTRTGEQANGRTHEHTNRGAGEQVNRRSPEQANTRTGEREITRQSYNVYTDQHMALKRLEAQASLNGSKPRTISEMVREAIRDFLQKQPQH
jgi:hypothetical protein